LLVVVTPTGHVDLYRDANFKRKTTRVRNVQTDVCYKLA
jgi:hypothetical protein